MQDNRRRFGILMQKHSKIKMFFGKTTRNGTAHVYNVQTERWHVLCFNINTIVTKQILF